jgi:hypothetical protein
MLAFPYFAGLLGYVAVIAGEVARGRRGGTLKFNTICRHPVTFETKSSTLGESSITL